MDEQVLSAVMIRKLKRPLRKLQPGGVGVWHEDSEQQELLFLHLREEEEEEATNLLLMEEPEEEIHLREAEEAVGEDGHGPSLHWERATLPRKTEDLHLRSTTP